MRKHLAFAGRVPPVEAKLWNAGPNPTDYGVHVWSERSCKLISEAYALRGNPYVIDLEHNLGLADELDPLAPTGGYCKLDIRNGEPWLLFEWSDVGAEQIATGQKRFLSPEYLTDEQTGEIVGLVRVSLVADPGTHHARVLATAKKEHAMDPMILAALRAALTAEDPKAAISALLEEMAKAAPAEGAPAEGDTVAAADGDKPKPFAPGSGSGDKEAGDVAATTDDKGKEPVACIADEKSKEAPVAAGAARTESRQPPPVPKLGKVTIPAQRTDAVQASSGPVVQDAITRVDDLERDMLLRQEGDRLVEPIRIWASRQPLAIVKGLIDAAPKRLGTPALPRPVQGGQLGATGTPVRRHLTGEARREFETVMGRAKLAPIGPGRSPEGYLRITTGCPGEFRRQQQQQTNAASTPKTGA